MAAKPLDESLVKDIIADWRTGAFSQQKLADKHKVSKGVVNKLCKGVAQDTADMVTIGVAYKQGLSAHDDRNVTAVTAVVDDRTKHLQFFTHAAVQNVEEAMAMICEDQNDFKLRADTILKGKEAVLGKEAGMVINNTNAMQNINPTRIEIVGV